MDALRLSFLGPSKDPRDCGKQLIDRYKEGSRLREDQILGTRTVGELAGDDPTAAELAFELVLPAPRSTG
jgi:hypothetical protein